MKTINKIIMPFISLIIGFGAGYLLFKGDCEKSLTDLIQAKSLTFQSTRTIITSQDSIQLMKTEFEKESRGLFYGDDGKTSLRGYHISRKDIEEILAAEPGVTAIGIYFGKHPTYLGKSDRIYTIMAMPAKLAPAGSANKYIDLYAKGVYDYTDICPNVCGTF